MDVNYEKKTPRGGKKINLFLFCTATRCTPKVMHFLMLDMESSIGRVELLSAATRQINQYTVPRGSKGISAELADSQKKKKKEKSLSAYNRP